MLLPALSTVAYTLLATDCLVSSTATAASERQYPFPGQKNDKKAQTIITTYHYVFTDTQTQTHSASKSINNAHNAQFNQNDLKIVMKHIRTLDSQP